MYFYLKYIPNRNIQKWIIYLSNMDKAINKASDRFFEARRVLGFSQVDFAKKLSTTQGNISNIESGRRDISIELAMALNELFSISTSWLLMGKGEMLESMAAQDIEETRSNPSDFSFTKTGRKVCSSCVEKGILIESLRETIEALKGNIESKDETIDVLREALGQAKARLEERGS